MSSCGGDQEGPAAKKSRMEKYFGDKELSDVVLQIGDVDLHVHKMLLAAKSTYFKQLFFTEGSEERNTFVINEDSVGVILIIDVLYNNFEHMSFDPCPGVVLEKIWPSTVNDREKVSTDLHTVWQKYTAMMTASEKYGIDKDFRLLLEYHFLVMDCRKLDCLMCTLRFLFALHYKFPDAEKTIVGTPKSTAFCMKKIGEFPGAFNISMSALLKIFGDKTPARETHAPVASGTAEGASKINGPIMCLATRSPYFHTMFFSGYKENYQDRITIEANGDAFKLILELIYNGNNFEDTDFLVCGRFEPFHRAWSRISKFWKTMPEIMNTLGFFNFPTQMVEFCLGYYYCGKEDCVECSSKKIFAMNYNLDNPKKKVTSKTSTIVSCLKNFPQCFPEQLNFAPNELAELIESV